MASSETPQNTENPGNGASDDAPENIYGTHSGPSAADSSKAFDLVIQGGTVVGHFGRVQTDIGIRNGKFAALGSLSTLARKETIDAKGLHVLPGVIDTQVHLREPGPTHKEDLETGGRAAVLGGVTGFFEMPNTKPSTTTQEAIEDKLNRAKGRVYCDHAFYVGATPDNATALKELEMTPGTSGVKIFMGSSTGDLLVDSDEVLDRVLASTKRRCAVHAEDEARLIARKELAVDTPANHPVWRDAESARLATTRVIALAKKYRHPVHVLHISTADELPLLAEAPHIHGRRTASARRG